MVHRPDRFLEIIQVMEDYRIAPKKSICLPKTWKRGKYFVS